MFHAFGAVYCVDVTGDQIELWRDGEIVASDKKKNLIEFISADIFAQFIAIGAMEMFSLLNISPVSEMAEHRRTNTAHTYADRAGSCQSDAK